MKTHCTRFTAVLVTMALLLGCMPAVASADRNTDYWLTDEKKTITFFIGHNYQTDFNESNQLYQKLEELTNVHVEWIVVSGSDVATRKSLMWASGDLPDIIAAPTNDEVLTYSKLGALLPLDEYKDYMPNFYAAMNDGRNDGIEQMLTLDDGHIYALPAIGLAYYTSGAPVFINTDWLDALKLDMPSTVDELREVLIAFRDGDPNGNGVADEIPMSFDWNYAGQDIRIGGIYAWFGVMPGLWIRDGQVNYGPYMQDYKTMVEYFADLWSEGLIDREVFTENQATYTAKASMNPSMYGVFNGWRKGLYLGDHNYDDYDILPVQHCPDTALSGAARTHMGEGREWSFNRCVVSSTTDDPELVCRWLDIFYDAYWGSQIADGYLGTHLYEREDGQFDEVPASEIPSQYASRDEWKFYTMSNSGPYYKAEEHCTHLATSAKWAVEMNHQSEVYEGKFINEVMMPSYQLPEEFDLIASYETDIVSYVKEMFALWVTGERNVDADWNEYIAKLEDMGVKAYIAAYQSYYDRVMNRSESGENVQ